MTNLAKFLSAFLRDYLPNERQASTNTCDTYAYTFQLLVNFAAMRLKSTPSKLTIEHLTVDLVVEFLGYLEGKRKNSVRTRNARAAAIKTFFRFLEYRSVVFVDQSRRIQAIPTKKTDERLIAHLSQVEMEAILDCPDQNTIYGIRDRAMLHLCFAAGLRVSELVSLRMDQLDQGAVPLIRVIGKGRRERILPLWKETASDINSWMAVRPRTNVQEIFINAKGQPMTRSGFKYVLSKYVKMAELTQPSLKKKTVSPHVLRHTCAILTLRATHDIRKVSLWLGHADLKSTEIYLRADPNEKLEVLMARAPLNLRQGKFKAPDKLMAMLKSRDFVQ